MEAVGVTQLPSEHIHDGADNHLDDLGFLDQMSGLGRGRVERLMFYLEVALDKGSNRMAELESQRHRVG